MTARLRFPLAAFPERYQLPGRPAGAPPTVLDAHRQTLFLLQTDLTVFERAMNAQLAIVAACGRTLAPQAAALVGLWSRLFALLADACALMTRGSYPSCPPLLRTACDCLAAQRSLLADAFSDYLEWLPGAAGQEPQRAALAIDLGRFRAGSVLAQDRRLGPLYRLLTDLSMPHFGATLLLTAPDLGLQKAPTGFADGAFHLGWAELAAGWLLALAQAQLETAAGSGLFPEPAEALAQRERLAGETEEALSRPLRCRAEEAGDRFLIHNFRRAASAVPKRVLL